MLYTNFKVLEKEKKGEEGEDIYAVYESTPFLLNMFIPY